MCFFFFLLVSTHTLGNEQYNTEQFYLSRKEKVSFSSSGIIPRVYNLGGSFYPEGTKNKTLGMVLCRLPLRKESLLTGH